MKKTFEEIAEEVDNKFREENHYSLADTNGIQFAIECMKIIREATLKEAADYAEVDYNYVGDCENIEVYVLKESILQLPKDTIEI